MKESLQVGIIRQIFQQNLTMNRLNDLNSVDPFKRQNFNNWICRLFWGWQLEFGTLLMDSVRDLQLDYGDHFLDIAFSIVAAGGSLHLRVVFCRWQILSRQLSFYLFEPFGSSCIPLSAPLSKFMISPKEAYFSSTWMHAFLRNSYRSPFLILATVSSASVNCHENRMFAGRPNRVGSSSSGIDLAVWFTNSSNWNIRNLKR